MNQCRLDSKKTDFDFAQSDSQPERSPRVLEIFSFYLNTKRH